MPDSRTDNRLARAWEKALQLPDHRKAELIDYVEFLASRACASMSASAMGK